jgi:hypothetical protein
VGEVQQPVRLAILAFHEDAEVATPGDDDAPFGVDGQAMDVVGEVALGEEGDLEAGGHFQPVGDVARLVGLASGGR